MTATSGGSLQAAQSFGYDANGNMDSRNGLSTTWYSYNLPNTINGPSSNSSQFFYAPDRSRWKQVASYAGTSEQTIYIGGLIEKVTLGGATHWKHYIAGGTGVVAEYIRHSTGTNETVYLLKDHLGSTEMITNSSGGQMSRLSHDAWGRRRAGGTWSGNPAASEWTTITNTTRHGFTSHEMLDNLNLVHMNGRVYDQIIGRFMSADPIIDGSGNTQGWNRYGYVKNSPLRFTDPSGFNAQERPHVARINGIEIENVVVEGSRGGGAGLASLVFGMQGNISRGTGGREHSGGGGAPSLDVIEEVVTTATRTHARGAAAPAPAPSNKDGGKCSIKDWLQDFDNAMKEAIYNMPNISLSLEVQAAFGLDSIGQYSQYSFSVGGNSLQQLYAQMQGGTNLQGSGDIAAVSVGFNLGYASNAFRTDVNPNSDVWVAAGYAYAGPGVSVGTEVGNGAAEGSIPEAALPSSAGRLATGAGLAAGLLYGNASETTAATDVLYGLIDPPHGYSGCGGQF